jgi:hypothetical protein
MGVGIGGDDGGQPRMAHHSEDAVAEDRHVRESRRRHLQWCHSNGRGTKRQAGQGRFLNRLRFAEVNAERSI